jgi:hypothetical protein
MAFTVREPFESRLNVRRALPNARTTPRWLYLARDYDAHPQGRNRFLIFTLQPHT